MKRLLTLAVVALSLLVSSTAFAKPTRSPVRLPKTTQVTKAKPAKPRINPAIGKAVAKVKILKPSVLRPSVAKPSVAKPSVAKPSVAKPVLRPRIRIPAVKR